MNNGGGIRSSNSVGDTPSSLRNTIVANNTAGGSSPNVLNPIVSLGFNLIGGNPLLPPLSHNGGLTRTHALLPGSPAIDAGDPATFPATDQRGIARPQDGDGKTDLSIFRPAGGEWFVMRSEDNSFYSFPFGTSGDIPAPSDFDGTADYAVFRGSNATWYVQQSTNGSAAVSFGAAGDQPIPNAFVR